MVEETKIVIAKQVDVNKVAMALGIPRDKNNQNMISCPLHEDKTPSCSYYGKKNVFKCFSCNHTFDSIELFRSYKASIGELWGFPETVDAILDIGDIKMASSLYVHKLPHKKENEESNLYDLVLGNCRKISGYELEYLKKRGIFVYDTYVYQGNAYDASKLEDTLQNSNVFEELDFCNTVKNEGVFYQGIAPILRANRIEIRHNYYNSINNIIYNIDFSYDDDEELQEKSKYLKNMERHMIIRKSISPGTHIKGNFGTTDFIWIADGMDDSPFITGNVYVCEGIEDALSFVQNGYKVVSLNSVNNIHSFIHYLESNFKPRPKLTFIMAFDHDEAGEKAGKELEKFFQDYNSSHKRQYQYAFCDYPEHYHDINDYWVSRVYESQNGTE